MSSGRALISMSILNVVWPARIAPMWGVSGHSDHKYETCRSTSVYIATLPGKSCRRRSHSFRKKPAIAREMYYTCAHTSNPALPHCPAYAMKSAINSRKKAIVMLGCSFQIMVIYGGDLSNGHKISRVSSGLL